MLSLQALSRPLGLAAAVALGALSLAPTGASAGDASFDDTARILAGLPVAAGSPLEGITKDGSWQSHAKTFDKAWQQLELTRLSKIRAWTAANMTADTTPVLYYMFSGPDFLHADAFFPNKSTYVLSALEPVGQVPDLATLSRGALMQDLSELRQSMGTILNLSYFITQNMRHQLASGRMTGTLPVLYVFLARAGKTITDVSYVTFDTEGKPLPSDAGRSLEKGDAAPGVKISFKGADGREQTLYYFGTDISDDGVKRSGFLKFLAGLGQGAGFIKSASYLPHNVRGKLQFVQMNNFLLENTGVMLQDDSGIPMRHFAPRNWQLHPFGYYTGPLGIFPGTNQPALARLYKEKAKPIDFGVGYRYKPRESNLLLAVKGDYPDAATTAPAEEPASEPPRKKKKARSADASDVAPASKPRRKKKPQPAIPFF